MRTKAQQIICCILALLTCQITLVAQQPAGRAAKQLTPAAASPALAAPAGEQKLSLDVKNSDLQDVIRMISKGYGLNIVLDKDVTGKVTVHLTDVPIMEGLRTIAETNGLEVVTEGNVYKIRKATEEQKSLVRYIDNKLTVDVVNMDVKEFLKELSSKTAVSIVPDNKVSGKISGKLYQVEFKDGITALLEGNGFKVSQHKNIYQVTSGDDNSVSPGMPMMPPRGGYGGARGNFYIDYNKGNLSMDISNGSLRDVVKMIADKSDIAIIIYGTLDGEVNAKLENIPLTEALALLLGGTRFTFVQNDNIILIGDRNSATPSGQALSKSEMVHLRHIKADEVIKILPKNIPEANIKVIKEQNALLVSGTSEDIVKTREFLKTVDIPTPQVRIDAVIVEFKDNLDKEFGLNFWRKSTQNAYMVTPAPKTRVSDAASEFEIGAKVSDVRDFYKNVFGQVLNLGNLPNDFFAVLRFLESQDKAKVLAQPSILTLNGYKASINVNETQYFKITAITGSAIDNYNTVRFQPITFGIKLDITPWISQSGQITCEISPEVSNSDGNSSDGYPNVSTRAVTTTVRLNDSETLVLGGLIKNQDVQSQQRIPFLGSIPILGVLFRYTHITHSKTNLVIYITPHIVSKNSDSTRIQEAYNAFQNESQPTIKQIFMRTLSKSSAPDTIRTGNSKVINPPADTITIQSPNNAKQPADSLALRSNMVKPVSISQADTTSAKRVQ